VNRDSYNVAHYEVTLGITINSDAERNTIAQLILVVRIVSPYYGGSH